MVKHTPGPWIACIEDNSILSKRENKTLMLVAQARSTDVSVAERDANSFLISAAPELLGALQSLISNAESAIFEDWLARVCPSGDASAVQYDWLHSSDYSDFCEDWKEAHAAISKAIGDAK